MSDLITHLARERHDQLRRDVLDHLAARAVADQRRAQRLASRADRLLVRSAAGARAARAAQPVAHLPA